jgi:diguanylate cyclase (GGDEF)-like protein
MGYEPMLDQLDPDDRARVQHLVDGLLRDGGDADYQSRVTTGQGQTRWLHNAVRSVVDEEGVLVRLHGITQDITQRKAFEEHLAHNSLHDVLTGLPNRSLLLDRLGRAAAAHAGRGGSIAVLGLDLDRFKVVNDSLGHAAGDELLVEVGKRLVGAVREGDTVARFGGDEFVLLCEPVDDEQAAVGVAERVLAAFERPVRLCGRDVRITTSIGIACTDRRAEPDELVRSADLAMYRAKSQGGGRVEVFDEAMNYEAVSRLELEADLRRAIDEGQLRVFYQPVVALESGAAVGVEALVRWEHPERGLVSPAEFIPLAEETGLIVPLGSWVLDEACRQVAAWQRARPGTDALSLAVNVSARQFADADLPKIVHTALEQSGLHPETLFLEITETTVMTDPDASAAMLRDLKILGVSVSIDDFGTGYSSMASLKKLPVDVLKVDRSFVSSVDGGPEDRAIVAAVVHLAEALELDVVAEGVERPAQAVELRQLGCGYAQGFDWSRPLPAPEAREWLDAHTRTADAVTDGDAVGRYRVLVADDLPEHRAMVRRLLQRHGSFTVVAEAADGKAAVELAALHQPDLVVLDIGMPTLDGSEALPLIRRESPETKVVVLSGDVAQAAVDNADAVLEKGLAPHRLVNALLEVLMRRAQEAEAR